MTKSGIPSGGAVRSGSIRTLGRTSVNPVPGRHGSIVYTDKVIVLEDSLALSGTLEVADTLWH